MSESKSEYPNTRWHQPPNLPIGQQSGPETGNPEMEESLCLSRGGDSTTSSPRGGPGGESFVSICFHSSTGSMAHNVSMKDQFPQPLGHTGCSLAVSNAAPPRFLPHPLLLPQAKSLYFEDTLLSWGIHGTGKSHSLLTDFTSGCIAS